MCNILGADIIEQYNQMRMGKIIYVGYDSSIKTISKALKYAKAGDTICVQGGVYREDFNINIPITIQGEKSERGRYPVIILTGTKPCHINANASFLNIEFITQQVTLPFGLSEKQCSKYGLLEISAEVHMLDCEVSDSITNGIVVKSGKLWLNKTIISNSAFSNIKVVNQGKVDSSNSKIIKSKKAGIEVSGEGEINIYKTKLNDNKESAVVLLEEGKALVNKCTIKASSNDLPIFSIKDNSKLELINMYIENKEKWIVKCSKDSECVIKDCSFFDEHRIKNTSIES